MELAVHWMHSKVPEWVHEARALHAEATESAGCVTAGGGSLEQAHPRSSRLANERTGHLVGEGAVVSAG